ncbi:putative lipase 2 [Xylariales sp. AK1849]|nr:putative lipase 2 [Xylariales sp. AK1849]
MLFRWYSPPSLIRTWQLCSNPPSSDGLEGLVNLGYAKYIPTYINTTRSGYRGTIYKKIRFASPPIGDLRFREPDTTLVHKGASQNGRDPWASRDCIAAAPSYVPFSDKDKLFTPLGLFDCASEESSFIFVHDLHRVIRLGIPGWTYADDMDKDANADLFDCLSVARRTAKYITAAGQTAGAGILHYRTTLHGGEGILPFQQRSQAKLFDIVVDTANCALIKRLRSFTVYVMKNVNDKLVNGIAGGGGGYFRPRYWGTDPWSMANQDMGLSYDKDMPKYFPVLARQIMPNISNKTVAAVQSRYHFREPAQLAPTLKFVHGKELNWPTYGKNGLLLTITAEGYKFTTLSPELEARCEALNTAILDPVNGV